MNFPEVCFAIVSPCHAIITGSEEWYSRNRLDCKVVDTIRLPSPFKRIVDCGYEFNCDEQEARRLLTRLGLKESKSLKESGILDQELFFDDHESK